MYLKFFESFTATVKFHDSQNERNMIRFLEGSKTNRKANSEHYFDILSPSMSLIKQCNFSTSQSEISDQNIQSASRWFTYDAANHMERKWQNKEKPSVLKWFTVDIFCLWDTQKRRYRTLHWESQCLPPYSHHVFFTGEISEIDLGRNSRTKRWVVRRIPSHLHFICTHIKV